MQRFSPRTARLLPAAALALLATAGAPAFAQVKFDFTTLAPSSFVACTSANDRCAASVGASLSFTTSGFTVAATGLTRSNTGAASNALSMQDYAGGGKWGGLGVYPSGTYSSSQDNIQNNDVLKLDFGRQVTLTSLAFSNHGSSFDAAGKWGFSTTAPVAGSSPTQFNFTANGVQDIPDTTGSTFYLYGLSDTANRTFYLSSLNVTAAPVPEPGTLGLLAAGLGAVTLSARRRKAAAAANAAPKAPAQAA